MTGSKTTKRVCTRCSRIYQGSPSSDVCESPRCKLVKAQKILRNALIYIVENKHRLTREKREQIMMQAVKKII